MERRAVSPVEIGPKTLIPNPHGIKNPLLLLTNFMKKNELEKSTLSQCNDCNHLCCKYITVKIPAPRTIIDFDGLLWQLSHKNVKAFKDSAGWYLLIYNSCSHLKNNGKCAIYKDRPITCREHSIDACEHDSPISEVAIQFFGDYQSLDNYCRNRFKTWDSRF
jgi:Fe-S-cluster containining protein